jgi:GT2 family glycosyltransferase
LDVSIIIVNWNTRSILRDCLRSVYERAGDIKFEVILIDNASSDGSAEMVRTEFPNATLIVNDSNRGYAGAMNQGMKIAAGRYFLLLNSDIIIRDRAIEKTLQYADSHPRAAVVGCQVLDDADVVQMTCFQFPTLTNLALRAFGLSRLLRNYKFFGQESMSWWKRDTEKLVEVVSGMFMFVRREAADKVGLMDEDYFFYSEDVDWCYRFSRAGWENIFWPGAQVVHLHGGGQSSEKVRMKSFVEQQKNILLFFRKHRGFLVCVLARLIMSMLFAVRWFGWIITVFGTSRNNPSRAVYVENWQLAWKGFQYCFLGLGPKDKW